MKNQKYIIWILALFGLMLPSGCEEEFLNRPPEDAYIAEEWFQTEAQLDAAANALYGGVWFDFQRSFLATWITCPRVESSSRVELSQPMIVTMART